MYLGIAPGMELAEPRCGGESVAECPGIHKDRGDTLSSASYGRHLCPAAQFCRRFGDLGSCAQHEGSNYSSNLG